MRRSPEGSLDGLDHGPVPESSRYFTVPSEDSGRLRTTGVGSEEPACEGFSQAGRQVGHLGEGARTSAVEPALELLCPETRFSEVGDKTLKTSAVESLVTARRVASAHH